MKTFTASPVCVPEEPPEAAAPFFAGLGFSQIEIFSTWTGCRYDLAEEPSAFRDRFLKHGLNIVSFHLPQVEADKPETLENAFAYAKAARTMGASLLLYKAKTIDDYTRTLRLVKPRIDAIGADLLLQNHAHAALSTIEDYEQVIADSGVEDIRIVLEVGHFVKVGVPWEKALERFRDRIGLVHIKDMRDGESVEYGTGTVDFPALFERLDAIGYTGTYVVEQEGGAEERKRLTPRAVEYLKRLAGEGEALW